MTHLISVLMPVLNEADSVARSVRAVLAQDGVEVEVLVIDGGSVDATVTLVEELADADPRVRLLHNPRHTIPAGLNIGLAAARGEFVARVDGHSSITPDYLATGLAWLLREPRMAAVGGRKIGVARTPIGRAIALAMTSKFGVGNSVYHYATEPCLTDHASFAVVRAAAAREVGGWDEGLLVNEDVDFDHRLRLAGYQIGFDPAMRFGWQVRESVPALFRQYRRYGRGKGNMIRKNGRQAVRARHLAPPAAVLTGAAGLLLATRKPAVLLAAVPYLALVGLASWRIWTTRDELPESHAAELVGATDGTTGTEPTAAWSLPLVFSTLHLAWGLGMLEGLVLRLQPARASGSSVTATSGAQSASPRVPTSA
ncbi:hypothetical protein FHX74_000833 [Friedmanniella endophytica]|uniref:Glycosyltransferase 2-like domain-containing protein n=1 Tax=Microlunatus kandeliicorticis TaxID=1759536 RepID=A0A7W3IQA4_9ACTN|nr:glycosyltransferase family 2 protein [Microlunatus kandeliicorticis]MBA8793239.1 hypothetical protein [Microlunatus kandeliicorticis]